MARFLNGLNEEISGFVEMFPYNNLQALMQQAMRIERKIQQEGRRRSYGSQSISAPWRRQQAGTSVVGGRSQGVAARPSPSFGAAKTTGSTASSPVIQQEQRRSTASTATPQLLQLLLLLPIVEALFVTSAKDEDMLLLSVLVKEP